MPSVAECAHAPLVAPTDAPVQGRVVPLPASGSGCPYVSLHVQDEGRQPSPAAPRVNPGKATHQQQAEAPAATGVHQAWKLRRPQLAHDPKLTRRQLRRLNKSWTLAEVAQHKYADDAWIAVDGKVYDITEHIVDHPGWDTGCQVTTVLSILAHLGIDCSSEFHDIHRVYPVAYRQLNAFYIGDLAA